MIHRRARPTLRVLQKDLISGWSEPWPQRAIAKKEYESLSPLSDLPHPLVLKAASSFNEDPSQDSFVGLIACSKKIRLLEIKAGQWRGGVWEDPESGIVWLLAAGLAKGNHGDREDFYQWLERLNESDPSLELLPTTEDRRVWRQEKAAKLLTDWLFEVQGMVFHALESVCEGGVEDVTFMHPKASEGKFSDMRMTIAPVREESYEADEVLIEFFPVSKFRGSELMWELMIRVLVTLDPPELGWDRVGDSFSNIAEPGHWKARLQDVKRATVREELIPSEPGKVAHYAHKRHLARSSVLGQAVRSLCDVYFVPTQDPQQLGQCPNCEKYYAALPGG